MKHKVTLLKVSALALIISVLLLLSTVPFYEATGHGAMLPAATIAGTPVPGTIPVADKYSAVREFATQAAAVPSATRYWPLPTVVPDFTLPWPPGTRQTPLGAGIIYDGQPPMGSSEEFTLKSSWAELLGERIVYVDTGGAGYMGDPTQGLVVVHTYPLTGHPSDWNLYQTPSKAGPVTVTDAVGERLTLEAPDGTRFTFDVATRQWGQP